MIYLIRKITCWFVNNRYYKMAINRKEIYLPKNKYTDHILHLFQIWICVLLSWTLLRKLPLLYLLSKKHSHFNKGKHQSTWTMSDVYKPPQHFHNVSHCSSMEQVSFVGKICKPNLLNIAPNFLVIYSLE